MEYLAKSLRRKLESTVIEARDMAETAARTVLEHLGIGETNAPEHLTEEQRALRRRLRAHGRQLGDHRRPDGRQSIDNLVQETGYEHWHRMLFARFLAESHLLMHPDGVPLTLDECDELAQDERAANGWELAGRYASRMLPQIFRPDSPVLALTLAPEHQRALERLLAGLDPETFQAQDSLGWVYQFWQSKKKDEVNRSEVKIGAEELPAVTQLFTEPYMVSFLLDNSLGAWWVSNHPDKPRPVSLEYLRILEDGSPAAGCFEAWPKHLSELKVLDPCCGSGHFLVAAFLMLVPMRMAIEGLSAEEAVERVLVENTHGLELDQRCVELAAFALALTAWRYPDAGGYRALPELNMACSGLSVGVAKEEWKQLALDKHNMRIALDWMHDTFRHAPVLGSLLNPAKTHAAKIVQWDELSETLAKALSQEQTNEQHEAGVVAQGLAKAATLLAGQYHWVITNVPYLTRGKQNDILRDFCGHHYPAAKNDLATVFLDRCLEFCVKGGTTSIVLPQNWLFLTTYKKFREKLLKNDAWHLIARLGPGAFETISGEVVKAILITMSRGTAADGESGLFASEAQENWIRGVDVSEPRTPAKKAAGLLSVEIKSVKQVLQLNNPDARVALENEVDLPLLSSLSKGLVGIQTGDDPRYIVGFWELDWKDTSWEGLQSTPSVFSEFAGQSWMIRWDSGQGGLQVSKGARIQGLEAIGLSGVAMHRVGELYPYHYLGNYYHQNIAVIIPRDPVCLPAIWCFCSSPEYKEAVRRIDQKLNVTNATLVKVPFDLDHWTKVAQEKYPNGLPRPYSGDPTQWIFHGHPAQSDEPLQVAVARLLGYHWPAETDPEMELSDEAHSWIARCKVLDPFVDDDGIACIPAIRGEKPAAERLLSLLQAAYGDDWSAHKLNQLLEDAKAKGKGLDWWLREKFFEQHCKQFQHRPFIWHIWDGLKDGFAALVNYHRLNHKTLETLIYTYLGDWIGLQERAVSDGLDGAELRLTAAQDLKKRLELILEGEAPYDIFVRWKPLEEQPIGWNPDLNDGVRLNIRPFMSAEVLRHNKKPKLNIHWNKDRGKDVESTPWYSLGLEYGGKEGDRINDHHLKLEEKRKAARH